METREVKNANKKLAWLKEMENDIWWGNLEKCHPQYVSDIRQSLALLVDFYEHCVER